MSTHFYFKNSFIVHVKSVIKIDHSTISSDTCDDTYCILLCTRHDALVMHDDHTHSVCIGMRMPAKKEDYLSHHVSVWGSLQHHVYRIFLQLLWRISYGMVLKFADNAIIFSTFV